jgi:hypothetical protein
MGKRRQGNTTPQKANKLIEDAGENEGNEHPVTDFSRMILIIFNEFNEIYRELLNELLKKEVIERLMNEFPKKLKENIENQLKEYQDNTNKNLEKTQEQLYGLREDINKFQNEIKEIMKKEIKEMKTAQDMKEEFNKYMENFRKKNQMEILEIKISQNQNKTYS